MFGYSRVRWLSARFANREARAGVSCRAVIVRASEGEGRASRAQRSTTCYPPAPARA
ncbi:hypothetical protein DP49_5648 [Burkholderia pseudomallei]|nr:hypothetical protein DP43_5451 [Burkholderia pseudomallei]KGD58379.1 hypothetical protein DP49_5648 [Burkholderia pseudomallei]